MTLFALRCRNVIARVGIDSPLMRLVAVGCPALIGSGILVFGMALLGRRRAARGGLAWSAERGGLVRLAVFVVPIMAMTQMAAALLGSAEDSSWATLLLAGLLPLVPIVLIAFAVLIFSASRLFADAAPRERTGVAALRRRR
jgi:hypothetical protein